MKAFSITHSKNFYGLALGASVILHGLLISYFGEWNLLTSSFSSHKPELIQKVKLIPILPQVKKVTSKNADQKPKKEKLKASTTQPKQVMLKSQVIPFTQPTVTPVPRNVIPKTEHAPPKKTIEQQTYSIANLKQPVVNERHRLRFQKPKHFLVESKTGTKAAQRKFTPSLKTVSQTLIPTTPIIEQSTFSQAKDHVVPPSSRTTPLQNTMVPLPPIYSESHAPPAKANGKNQIAALTLQTQSKTIDTGEESGIQETSSEFGSGEGFSGPDLQELKANYVGQIRERVARFKHYPKMALRRELEGKPVLLFKIGKDGRVLDLTLSESSGSGLLDEAALDSVKKGAPFPVIPLALKQEAITIQLPITFTLD